MDFESDIAASEVKDLKTFTMYCKLSAPTIKKWLEGEPIYKSSMRKVNKALKDCNLTKFDLLKLKRKFKKKNKNIKKHDFQFMYDFEEEESNDFPSLSGVVKYIHSHVYNVDTNSIHYLCETHKQSYPYELLNSQELYTYNDINKIRKYWELKNSFIQE